MCDCCKREGAPAPSLPPGGHHGHKVVQTAPRITGTLQMPVRADHLNHVIDPPALRFSFVGRVTEATVTVESLLYALYVMEATKEKGHA